MLELSWGNRFADQQVAFRACARTIGGSRERYKSNPSSCDLPKIKAEIFRLAPRRLWLSIIGPSGACLILRPLRPWDCENDNRSVGFARDAARLSGPASYQGDALIELGKSSVRLLGTTRFSCYRSDAIPMMIAIATIATKVAGDWDLVAVSYFSCTKFPRDFTCSLLVHSISSASHYYASSFPHCSLRNRFNPVPRLHRERDRQSAKLFKNGIKPDTVRENKTFRTCSPSSETITQSSLRWRAWRWRVPS